MKRNFWILNALIFGGAMMAAGCGDSTGATRCHHGETRTFACGGDKSGMQPQTCVDGTWYSTNFCANPDGTRHADDQWGTVDSCEDGATRAAVCGEGNKGLRPELCTAGEWEPTNDCSYGEGNTDPNGDPDAGGDTGDEDVVSNNNTPNPNDCTFEELAETSISSAVTLDGCYDVNANIKVNSSGHLTIAPGSILRFGENYGIDVDGGKLTAEGSAESGIIFMGQLPNAGFWRGVRFRNSNSISNKLVYITIDGGGNPDNFNYVDPANLMLSTRSAGSQTKVILEHATLRNSGAWGLSADAKATISSFVENTLTKNTLGAALMSPPALASLSDDSDYTGNTVDVLAVSEGILNESATWKGINVPYRVTGNIGVSGDGNKLVIEAGAEFEFDENRGLDVDSKATLTAVGDAANPIIFRGGNPTPGFWRGIRFRNTVGTDNKLVHITIDGGGSADNFNYADPANLMLSTRSAGGDVRITLEHATLKNSGTWGISADAKASISSFVENTLTGNTLGPALVSPAVLDSLGDASDYSGNTVDLLAVREGMLDTSATWKGINVPYRVLGDIGVSGDGNKLVIEAGAEFEFDENKGLSVDNKATLSAVGDASNPIIFRGSTPTPGFWRGIRFRNTVGADNQLVHITIDGGGSDDNFNYVDPANLMLSTRSAGGEVRITLKNATLSNGKSGQLLVDSRASFASCENLNISEVDLVGDAAAIAAAVVACGL